MNVIKFLDHNGSRPIIALVVIIGALVVTLKSDTICVVQVEYPQAVSISSETPASPPRTDRPSPSLSPQTETQTQVIFRDNPVCSKYFEIAALVLGGLLGLAEPGRTRPREDESSTPGSPPKDESSKQGLPPEDESSKQGLPPELSE